MDYKIFNNLEKNMKNALYKILDKIGKLSTRAAVSSGIEPKVVEKAADEISDIVNKFKAEVDNKRHLDEFLKAYLYFSERMEKENEKTTKD